MTPSKPNPAGIEPLIRDVTRDLAEARDEQVARIVHVIDAMADRGRIDDLLASVRPRLSRMRLGRPLRFTRLLFSPLDSAIVEPRAWRPGAPTLPRSALDAMAATVRVALGPQAEAIERMIAGRTTHDTETVQDAGRLLWPEGARILQAAPPPVDWDRTGINRAAYPSLARIVGAVLMQTTALENMASDASRGTSPPALESVTALVTATRSVDAEALPLLLVVLLARVPLAVSVLSRMSEDGVLRRAMERAEDAVVDQLHRGPIIESQVGRAGLTAATDAARQIAALLRELEEMKPSSGRREKLMTIRQALDQACRARFGDSMTHEFLAPLATIGTASAAVTLESLEDVARGLRGLETEGRTIGGAPVYDQMLGRAGDTIRGMAVSETLELADKARLLEIVADPEAALALYEAGA